MDTTFCKGQGLGNREMEKTDGILWFRFGYIIVRADFSRRTVVILFKRPACTSRIIKLVSMQAIANNDMDDIRFEWK